MMIGISGREGGFFGVIIVSAIWLMFSLGLTIQPLVLCAEDLTIDRIVSMPSLTGTAPANPVWSPDSRQLAFLWNNEAMPFRDVWVVPSAEEAPRRITDMARDFPYPDREAADACAKPVFEAEARSRGGVSSVIWTPDSRGLILRYQGDLFRVDADGKNLRRLTGTQGRPYALAYSPDGRYLSYLQEGDLWLWDQENGRMIQATNLGKPPIGRVPGSRGDFRSDKGIVSYKWSPANRHVALYFEDSSKVRKVIFPDYLSEETTIHTIRRDYPGDNDRVRKIAVYSVENNKIRTIEPDGKTNRGISNYSWSPDGSKLVIDQNSQTAIDRWIYVFNIQDGSIEKVWEDSRGSRIWQLGISEWGSDGTNVLFISDHNGYNQLHSLSLSNLAAEQLTSGDWEIVDTSGRSVSMAVSSRTKEIYFIAAKKNPQERHVYKIQEKGGPVRKITSISGCFLSFALAPDGSKLALLHSNDVRPTELYVIDTRGDASEHRITHSPPEDFKSFEWIRPRYVTFKSHVDGVLLYGRLIEPANLDKSKKYPVICGPIYSDTVRKLWNPRFGSLQQYLVLEGQYIIFQVDLRRSSGYGSAFRDRAKYDLGGIDLEDLYSGVKYLSTLSYVDPDRIGIWGTSYGGLVTVLSLFKKPGVYKAGVAGAPATNCWHANAAEVRNFGEPDTHPEALRKASAICYGEDLKDHLMIIHGMRDTVVQFKDSVALAEKLMLLGKDFDLVAAPSANHGWAQKDYVAAYLFKKLVGHFDRYLGRGPK